jgi:hypothetical protein
VLAESEQADSHIASPRQLLAEQQQQQQQQTVDISANTTALEATEIRGAATEVSVAVSVTTDIAADAETMTTTVVTSKTIDSVIVGDEFVDHEAAAEGISNVQDICCFSEELRKAYIGTFVAVALLSDHQLDSRMALCLQDSADSCDLSHESMIEIRDIAFDDPSSIRAFLGLCMATLSRSVLRYSVALDLLCIHSAALAESKVNRHANADDDDNDNDSESDNGNESDNESNSGSEHSGSDDNDSERESMLSNSVIALEALREMLTALGITPEQQVTLEKYTEYYIDMIDAGDDNLLLDTLEPDNATFASLFADCHLPRNIVFQTGKTPLASLLVPALRRVQEKLLAQSTDDNADDDDNQSDHEASHSNGSAEHSQNNSDDEDAAHSDNQSQASNNDGHESDSDGEQSNNDEASDHDGASENDDASDGSGDAVDDLDDDDEDDGPGFTLEFIEQVQARKRSALGCIIS